MGIATDIILIVVAAFSCGLLLHRLGQPLLLGYVLAGVLLGPSGLDLATASREEIELLAEIGVALLLFALGLEFSLKDLLPVRAVALLGAPLQIILTAVFGFGLGRLVGWEAQAALWFGALISVSSTMVVLKSLSSQGRIGTLSSKVMVGILVVQDLAVVVFMVVLPELGTAGAGLEAVLVAGAKAAVFLAAMIVLGTRLLPRLMAQVARVGDRELFLLAVTAIGLGVGYLSWLAGLSFALGAFLAGLVVSESDFGHRALSDIVPVRDLFGLLFFASVGMMLDLGFLADHLGTVAALVAGTGVLKGVLLAALVRAFGYRRVVPLAAGLGLFQVGEFAFVLAEAGREAEAFGQEFHSIFVSMALLSMVLTPLVSGRTTRIYAWMNRRWPPEPLESGNLPDGGLREHLVVAGGGRVAGQVLELLGDAGWQVVVIELDHRRLVELKAAGHPVVYGDASQESVLRGAGLPAARLLILTIPGEVVAQSIVRTARRLRPDIPILARARSVDMARALQDLGVDDLVLPEYEAGNEMARRALLQLGVSPKEVHELSERQHVQGLAALLPAGEAWTGLADLARLRGAEKSFHLQWYPLDAASPLAGRSIGELQVRTRTGASVVGVLREEELVQNPGADFHFAPRDKVAILGTEDARTAFRRLLAPDSGEQDAGEPPPA